MAAEIKKQKGQASKLVTSNRKNCKSECTNNDTITS